MPHLTDARRALWEAIDNWPSLNILKRKFRMEDTGAMQVEELEPEPTIGDLPAIAIVPTVSTSEWVQNQLQDFNYVVDIRIWTRHWSLLQGENIIQEIIDAGTAPAGPVHNATGHRMQNGPFGAIRIFLQEDHLVTLWTFQVSLITPWRPSSVR